VTAIVYSNCQHGQDTAVVFVYARMFSNARNWCFMSVSDCRRDEKGVGYAGKFRFRKNPAEAQLWNHRGKVFTDSIADTDPQWYCRNARMGMMGAQPLQRNEKPWAFSADGKATMPCDFIPICGQYTCCLAHFVVFTHSLSEKSISKCFLCLEGAQKNYYIN